MGTPEKNIVLWYKVVLHFSDIDMLCIFPLKERDVETLYNEKEKLLAAGELTDEEIQTGVYGEGIVDSIDWQWYVDRYETTLMRYEYPVSVDLEHPLTHAELAKYPSYPDPLTDDGFRQLIAQAERCNIVAMQQVADCYQCGNGTTRDDAKMKCCHSRYIKALAT